MRVDEATGREIKITGSPPLIRPIGVSDIPSEAKLSAMTHEADLEYGHVRRSRQKVDSKHDSKASRGLHVASDSSRQNPAYVGTTYRHYPNSANMRTGSVPTDPSIPVPYVAAPVEAYRDMRMLTNRRPGGDILGSTAHRFVDVSNVPPLPVVDLSAGTLDAVGPDNPVKAINDTWSECWDEEVQGIYYYNKLSGEATWLPPEELQAFLEKRKFANSATIS